MKTVKLYVTTLIAVGLMALFVLLMPRYAEAALTPNEIYTITIEAVRSNGTLTSAAAGNSLGLSATATADSNGKLSFSLSSVPNSNSYNFLVVTITDSGGTIARRSIVPAPAAGATLNLGVSPVTNAQTAGFISAFAAAGTDDPIMALMGYLIVRTTNLTTDEITTMATFCYQGIKGTDGTGLTDGYEAYLRSKGATNAQLVTFRKNIVANLSAYCSLYKDSVDEYFTSGATAECHKRGEAAGRLLSYLVDAGSDAGIDEEDLLVAMQAMGMIVMPLKADAIVAGTISAAVAKAIDGQICRAVQKLRADKYMKKYTLALTTLGASDSEVSKFNTAATNLLNTMIETFQSFENTVNGDELPTADDIDTASNAQNTAMEAAFNTFMTATAASDAEIADLRSRLKTALELSDVEADLYIPADMFKFYDSAGGQKNWPIMMVVSTRWMATILTNGGSLTYTRDNLTVPVAMVWLGECSKPQHWNEGECVADGGTWTTGRKNFETMFPTGKPQTWAALEGMREDIEIVEFTKFKAFGEFLPDPSDMMNAMKAAEELFYTRLAGLKDNLGGTTDGSTLIPTAQKKAVITVFCSPDF